MAYFERNNSCFIILFISCVTFGSDASRITFKASPDVLKANLTSAVAMRCGLGDTAVTRMTVTNTTDDIAHVTSILITHSDGQVDVAHVSAFDAATAFTDVGNLEVKGDVTGSSSEGFLELTWKIPSLMTLGEYACEIRTIDTHHHGTVFRSTLEMSVETPSINDVVVMFQTLQLTTKETEAKYAAEIRDLQHKLSNQTMETSNQNQQITSLTQMLKIQAAEVTKLKTCTSSHVAFMAVLSSTMSFSVNHPIVYDKVLTNTDGGYDARTGEFRCQTPGVYFFSVNMVVGKNSVCLQLRINSVATTTAMAFDSSTYESGSASAVVQLTKDDKVQVVSHGCGTPAFYKDSNVAQANVFTGHLLHNDVCLP